MGDNLRLEDVVMPALLGRARQTYGEAIRAALFKAGFDDMPKRGSFVVGSLARNGEAQQAFAEGMGISKQAASQLVDALATRGYVVRKPDPDDRRKMIVSLTPRGTEAAAVSRKAIAKVDAAVMRRITEEDRAGAFRVLGALMDVGDVVRERIAAAKERDRNE